ncbi:hypothetical protein HS041_10520 [Planomonospora sp. ID67723]|uniref:hypothetical protein n=1 Tax=Planomonospora sp. ID67723 TaxID=2738134 RepID=UPI0018C3E756|nr:hypothetical protein [Planomonospora sp. ID67723]MBG0828201.1 hypothetical protein [Planomonospora sp. ID67723]
MRYLSRAMVLADTEELGHEGAMMCGRCRATGLDVRSFAPLIGATLMLGVRPPAARGWTPYPDDRRLVDDLIDLADLVAARAGAAMALTRSAGAARAHAVAMFAEAACADPPRQQDMASWAAVMGDCDAALEVLQALLHRLRVIYQRLMAAPEQLGETYAAAYRLVSAGRVLPYDGRWLTSTT